MLGPISEVGSVSVADELNTVRQAIPQVIHKGDGIVTVAAFLWYDIHEATRKVMHKSLINRREQMVSDGLQLTFDATYWNKYHPDEQPIELPMDLTDDIQWRINAPKDGEEAA